MLVYRLQTSKNEGPYGFSASAQREISSKCYGLNHPAPGTSFFNVCNNYFDVYDQLGKRGWRSSDCFFGFTKIESFLGWWEPAKEALIKQRKFVVFVYEVPDDFVLDGYASVQCIFNMNKAVMKEKISCNKFFKMYKDLTPFNYTKHCFAEGILKKEQEFRYGVIYYFYFLRGREIAHFHHDDDPFPEIQVTTKKKKVSRA